MRYFFWGALFGFLVAVSIHSAGALKTLQQVIG